MPQFVPFSVESSPGSKLDARLKVRLARLQLEKEEREFQLHRELELRKLEAETIKLRQLEMQANSVHFAVNIQSSSTSSAAFDVSKHISPCFT